MASPCCPPGSWEEPLNVSGPPDAQGELLTIGSSKTPIYYSAPPSPSSSTMTAAAPPAPALVVFTDVWGFSPRLKSICDVFASRGGYHVVMPDCFRGDTKAHHEQDFCEWLRLYPYETVVSKDIDACIEFLHSRGVSVFGSIGFCWGAWAIAKSTSIWKAGVAPHPSTKIESVVFDQDEDAMLEKVNMPFLLMPANNDPDNLKPGSSTVKHLEEKGGTSILFEDMVHGWVTRGDLNDDRVKRDANAALNHALAFFDLHLKQHTSLS